MAATVAVPPAQPTEKFTRKQTAKITSKGQITIPVETRQLLGVKPGDKLLFEFNATGDLLVRKAEELTFKSVQNMATGIPELDNGSIEDIVQWFRKSRGHDEVDDEILGTSRFGKGK